MKIHLYQSDLWTSFLTHNVLTKCKRKVKVWKTRFNCYRGEESLFCKHCLNKINKWSK